MVDRRDVGSWLESAGTHRSPGGRVSPGERLGLPPVGPGSVARVGRRLAGVTVDWAGCLLISQTFLGGNPWTTLGLFAALHLLTIGTVGASPGHALVGLRVQRVSGGWPGPLAALVRTTLLCLAVPALVFDADQRGLHDRAAGTVLVRR